MLHEEGDKVLHVLQGIILAHKPELQKLVQCLDRLKHHIVLLISQQMSEGYQ